MSFKKYISVGLLVLACFSVGAQNEQAIDMSGMTREKVLSMSIEDFSSLPLEQLMQLMDIAGVSSLEELYQMLLNKDVTSASKSEESLFESPLSTTVLSYDEILASGATSIPEALRLVPGIIVREKTNGNYDVHVRGNDNMPPKNMMLYSENNTTLVMINGRPVFNYAHGGTLWETLPVGMEDVDRIEVVRGPASALYGPNAVTGVINIMTKEILDNSPLFSGTVQDGSLSTHIREVAFRKRVSEKLSVGLTGNFEHRNRDREEIRIYNTPETQIDGVTVGNGWYNIEQLGKLHKPSNYPDHPGYYLFPEKGSTPLAVYDIDDVFEDPELALEKYGLNGYLSYRLAPSKVINVSGGYQNSDNIGTTFGDMPTPYSGRQSSTGYVDLRADIEKFSFQTNYNYGTIDYMTGNEGFELDLSQFSCMGEYGFKLNNLGVRPGISYQSIAYDDRDYLSEPGRGYLNQKREINIFSTSLRFDYTAFEKLRLVAALRAEKYNNPSDWYASWQFVGSYKINDNHLFRGVYSRANQSAFLINTYSNYTWNIVNRDFPRVMHFGGDKEHKLKSMDMFEVGYRCRPVKSLLVDVEAFYQETKDFGSLLPDYTTATIVNPSGVLLEGLDPMVIPDSVSIVYQNMALKSKQMGASLSLDWILSEKVILKAHVTIQETKLDNYMPFSRDSVAFYQAKVGIENVLKPLGEGIIAGTTDPGDIAPVYVGGSGVMPAASENDYEHKSTPSVWGSIGLTYKPVKKLDIFAQGYYYGDQTFVNQYDDVAVCGKFLLNAKISYHLVPGFTLFVNGRNILNDESPEFAFMDNIGALYLGGLHFEF